MAVFATVLLFTLVSTGATKQLDDAVYGFAMRLTHFKPSPNIVLVAVDSKSLDVKGQWPWSRGVEADLTADITRDRPAALAWYFLFLTHGSPAEDQAMHSAMLQAPTYLPTPQNPAHAEQPWLTLQPIPIVASAAAGLGQGDADTDEHTSIRRAFLLEGARGRLIPQIVLQMARLRGPVRHLNLTETPASPGANPLYRAGETLIPFRGPPGTFTRISASSVLDGQVKPGYFHNKFVLVGPTAPGLLDNYQTPMSSSVAMPNIEIQANILNSLIDRQKFIEASSVLVVLVSTSLVWLFLIALIRLGPRDNLWLAVGMMGVPFVLSVLGVALRAIWFPPTPYLATLAIVVPYWGWRRLTAASAYFSDQLSALEHDEGPGNSHTHSIEPRLSGDIVLQQITLLESAKRRLSDLRRFVDEILANFPDPVLVVDRAGHILRTNSAAARFAEQIGVSVAASAPVQPILAAVATSDPGDHLPWPPAEIAQAPGAPRRFYSPKGTGPEGHAYELRFTPTQGSDDEPTGWIVHLADVTLLVSAMRQREEALQLLSHDMRSPQAAILAILTHPDFEGVPVAARKRLESQARRTLEMADSFVRLAQAESADYRLEPIDLTHVVTDAAEAVWPLAQRSEVKVRFEPDDVEYVVLADRRLLTRALINLLDNAIKFSPAGETVTCRLSPGVHNGAGAVVCEIADSAGGMQQAQLAELFHRFATSRDDMSGSPGVGLGLALVHTVVTRHHGVISCDSAEGEGTVFTLTLPLCETAETESLALAEA